MKKEQLTIVIANYNSLNFIELSLDALAKLTSNKYKTIICDNGSKESEKRKLKKLANNYQNVKLIFRKQSAPGSIGHGEALNILIEKINTPYGVVLDSDAILLKKGWDEILINQINNKTKIVGCSLVRNNKPTGLLSVYVTLFDTKIFKSLKIDMRSKDPQAGLDTGWEMQEKFTKNNYHIKFLDVRSTKEYKDGPFRNIICGEFYINGHDGIFACHFGRGSTLGMGKYYKGLKIPIVNNIIRKIKGYYDRKKWLEICREIIYKESGINKDLEK